MQWRYFQYRRRVGRHLHLRHVGEATAQQGQQQIVGTYHQVAQRGNVLRAGEAALGHLTSKVLERGKLCLRRGG